MRRASRYGLFQLRDRRTRKLFPTHYTRRDVPADVRARLGNRLTRSTGETSEEAALKVAERIWTEWDVEIAEARKLGGGPLATIESVSHALDDWRRERCAAAAGLPPARSLAEMVQEVQGLPVMGEVFKHLAAPVVAVHFNDRERLPAPSLERQAAEWARGYFHAHPDASRSLDAPLPVGLLLGRLQVAAREPRGWTTIPEFDAAYDAAHLAGVLQGRLRAAGLAWTWHGLPAPDAALEAALADAGAIPSVPSRVRDETRQRFAASWLEVLQHLEAERRRAATFLAALDAATAAPDAIRVAPSPSTYAPREDDKTLGEVIDLYRADRIARHGQESTDRKYKHLFSAIEETLGRDKPVRAITREDAGAVRDLLARVPSNAAKFYPKRTLAEAADQGAKDGRKRMAPNTLRSYLANFAAVLNYAVDKGYAERNPARGLAPPKRNTVKRRAFSREELEKLFTSLAQERRADDAKFWIPALLLFTGARANEMAQLRTSDVKVIDDTPYLDLTLFDDQGVRVEDKRLKTAHSERCVPVHAELITAGFLQFVGRQREAGETRLFPALKPGKAGDYSHDFTKWFGRHMDRIGMPDPGLVLHSMRHGFRNAGRRVVAPEVLDGLGGWRTPGVGANYGETAGAGQVVENLAELARMNIGGGFSLGPVPLARAA